MRYSDRLNKLPPYLFAAIEKLKQEKKKAGVDLIPLGIGDPDLPTPQFIVHELVVQVQKPENH